ncbi:N-acetylneuraminate synthase family protein [Candidatus Thioglobus sp.]|nr:N-acetylneuraminate synthase family protein [Candidatus Thioglobus sp.]
MKNKILQAIKGKERQDIVVIGKGPSIDAIDLSLIEKCITINVNDSELVCPGDIAVFHYDWVIGVIGKQPKCKLYITDKVLPKGVSRLNAQYVSNNPDTADFLISRFFSKELYIEHAIVISALRIANEIAQLEGSKKNVYLLGFDFTRKDGFTNKTPSAAEHDRPEYQERVISSQEQSLEMLLFEKKLFIDIKHVGSKQYSQYSVDSFNKIFSQDRYRNLQKTNQSPTNQSPTNQSPTNQTFKNRKVKIVAEITTNHFGDMDRLKIMIASAKQAGADFVKFQKRDVESFYSINQLESQYNSPFGKTFRDYRLGIELNKEQFLFIDRWCKEIGIEWFASVLDMPSYEFISEFNPKLIKLPSTISEHKDFLREVAKKHTNDLIISTGYTDKNFEEFVINNFTTVNKLYLLQCTSSYPTPDKHSQIGVVRHYYNLSKKNSKIIPGFSSHDIGSLCSMMAVSAGALMIEKHVKFGDVSWSHFDKVAVDLENGEFEQFVEDIRHAEEIVGGEEKIIHKSEHHKYRLKPED